MNTIIKKSKVYRILYRFSVINVIIDGIGHQSLHVQTAGLVWQSKTMTMENSHWSKKSQNS